MNRHNLRLNRRKSDLNRRKQRLNRQKTKIHKLLIWVGGFRELKESEGSRTKARKGVRALLIRAPPTFLQT